MSREDSYMLARRLFAEKKFAEAFAKYHELATQGDPQCQVFVGWMCHDGVGTRRDEQEALRWFHQAASLGSKEAAFYCGKSALIMGDYETALDWLRKAAAQDYSPALLWLGLAYLRGLGVEIDKPKGLKLLQRAAGMGNYPARRELAVAMTKGKLGVLQIPVGIFLFVRAVIAALIAGLSEGNSEKLMG